jgi:Predicted transcriptional regulator with C-terminal CBS domains
MKNKKEKLIRMDDLDDILKEKLKNPRFKKMFDEHGRQLELSYKILQLRKQRKMSQETLAKKIGTTQSNVARMEAGNQNFTLSLLNKVANALDAKLEIDLKIKKSGIKSRFFYLPSRPITVAIVLRNIPRSK